MTSYILKNNNKEKKVLLLEEIQSYEFKPKNTYKWVKKVTICDPDMINLILEKKIKREYEKMLKLIYDLISAGETSSDDVLVAYTELDRIKEYLLSLQDKGLKVEVVEKYLKKLYILNEEVKKIPVYSYEKGKGR